MKLGIKAKRNIGLVVVTLAIVVAIILVIYFVQKNDADSKIKTGAIGQTVSTSQADVCVKDMQKLQSHGSLTAEDGKCFLLVSVEIKANKKLTVSTSKFEIKDGKNITAEGREQIPSGDMTLEIIACEGEIALQKGESQTYQILYEVEDNRVASYYLYAYGAKIDLGGTVSANIKNNIIE
ncbi:MAG: DUF4352 domain-containing protein [Clostridia bacterium]|nr:DUF4352 domain-containing protein [Clostridia bacterium]MDE7348286.1 DUF4352 domain-containing protein [Clostridia bacterium]